jgi:hypothetical protein
MNSGVFFSFKNVCKFFYKECWMKDTWQSFFLHFYTKFKIVKVHIEIKNFEQNTLRNILTTNLGKKFRYEKFRFIWVVKNYGNVIYMYVDDDIMIEGCYLGI